jgi:hypothetical protein
LPIRVRLISTFTSQAPAATPPASSAHERL